ncbi:hypothetical protein CGLO_12833 [Colletotrichum gloeosporioides Cg-14]|uniref:Uncharacterized protein n=1 Tax=Colletotrichum gloeosporioides (strain Cg-14) TaxID=1237896 RepID=T0LIM9_COLGC|nr:hypothetical protein CGLO_12833 [Colletotrichum gloeosporioides Cg-14]
MTVNDDGEMRKFSAVFLSIQGHYIF